MQTHPINELYSEYKQGIHNRSEFEGLIFHYYLKNQEKTTLGSWKRYDYEDFLSWFYLRLHNCIDAYCETGASFEAFLGTIMRRSAKEYRIRSIINNITEYSAWCVHLPEMYACEDSPGYFYTKPDEDSESPARSNEKKEAKLTQLFLSKTLRKSPKQFLALVLKCYYYVSDDFLERVSRYTGVSFEKLKEMIEDLRGIRAQRDKHIYKMRENLYSQFYRCIVYEKRLSYLAENSIPYMNLKQRLEKARQRLERMRKRITHVRTDATNREVAKVIGVSKGAVDSSLFNLKNKWELLVDKAILN